MSQTIDELTPQQREWIESLPLEVQARVLQFPPGEKFLLKPTGHVVRMLAYTESQTDDGSTICDKCQVIILQEDNGFRLAMERRVFGILFDELEPIPEGFVPLGDGLAQA